MVMVMAREVEVDDDEHKMITLGTKVIDDDQHHLS